eukprot:7391613-Prymnesium_polylepis.1
MLGYGVGLVAFGHGRGHACVLGRNRESAGEGQQHVGYVLAWKHETASARARLGVLLQAVVLVGNSMFTGERCGGHGLVVETASFQGAGTSAVQPRVALRNSCALRRLLPLQSSAYCTIPMHTRAHPAELIGSACEFTAKVTMVVITRDKHVASAFDTASQYRSESATNSPPTAPSTTDTEARVVQPSKGASSQNSAGAPMATVMELNCTLRARTPTSASCFSTSSNATLAAPARRTSTSAAPTPMYAIG